MLPKVLRNTTIGRVIAGRNQVQYNPTASKDKVNKWMGTVSSKATSPGAKGNVVQLSSLISYYNRLSTDPIPEIDWSQWKDVIQTEGLVDKVKTNFETLQKEQYNIDAIVNTVISAPSKELENISLDLKYHQAVWVDKYSDYVFFLFELEDYGNPEEYLMHQNYDIFYGLEAELEELTETHNWLPGSKDDINIRGYYASQFLWGKKVISYYRHPADDFKSAKATKNILGR
eukprot:CAMPEP_0176432130 /NCGR_PEP_ID=MMETSP0127-20121128/15210_1 /TAXON_ID=938130 /ORGANISM="Platyophrya macrostoma, Strain WH" /LENGTH=229 /DNA_ID=CAMNT_0017814241 /DNA_START=44 /DNA_END=733 /DNA_ORIENTATION=-